MTVFPALIPSTRTFSAGEFPHTSHQVYDGSGVRVRHSNSLLGVRLRLFFPAITSAELLTVIAHYAGQRGRFLPFAIPDELLSGVNTPADFTPAGHQWRYAAKPTAVDISVDGSSPSNLHDLTVELESVPSSPTVFVPRVITRLDVLEPVVLGTPNSVDVPAIQYEFSVLPPTVEAVGAPSDPDFASVSLLLPMDGTNGSTTFTDASSNAFTITVGGGAQIGTAQSKFGGASGDFTTAGTLTTPTNAAFTFDADLTIEFWVRRTGSTGTLDSIVSAAAESTFLIRADGGNPGIFVGAGNNICNTLSFAVDTWHHIAVVRESGTWAAYKDGVDVTTATVTDATTRTFTNIIIGDSSVSGRNFIGYIDDFRVTKGIARYTAAFTPPTAAHPTS